MNDERQKGSIVGLIVPITRNINNVCRLFIVVLVKINGFVSNPQIKIMFPPILYILVF